ncbi:MAG: flagellar basal body P-ring formation chaperone FlgA [Betaproteobacteria bacterium]
MNFSRPRYSIIQLIWIGCLLLSPLTVFAQQNTLYNTLEDFIRTQTQGSPGKVSFTISQLDTRTQLTPCSAFEPFMPQGSKLWGKTTVGVRCLGPSNWTIYVPVQVSVSGNYLVSARNFQAGNSITANDIIIKNGDLSTLPSNILTDQSQAIGKTVKNGLGAGQPIRSDQLIAPWAVQQGQSVKTVSNGPGFTVSSEGKALNNAIEGQVVQVRTASGQTVSGVARPGGVVEVSH